MGGGWGVILLLHGKDENSFEGEGFRVFALRRVKISSLERVIHLPRTYKSITVKKNNVGSAVNEILCNTHTHTYTHR